MHRFGYPIALAAMCVLLGSSVLQLSAVERPADMEPPPDVETQLRAHVRFLASDDLRGRDVADEKIHEAANYIASHMFASGLTTTAVDGTPFQSVTIPLGAEAGPFDKNYALFRFQQPVSTDTKDTNDGGSSDQETKKEETDREKSDNKKNERPGDDSEQEEAATDELTEPVETAENPDATPDRLTRRAKLGEEMNPLAIGAVSGKALERRLVFVGYGITAPNLRYDDYAGLDVKDAIVIVLRKEPGVSDPNSPFDGVKNTRHAYFATKIQNAIKHGAAAVMIVNDPASIDEAAKVVRYRITQETKRSDKIIAQIKNLPGKAKNTHDTYRLKLEGIKATIKGLQLDQKKARKGLLSIGEAGAVRKKSSNSIPVISISRLLIDDLMRQHFNRSLADIESGIDSLVKPDSRVFDGVMCSVSCELKPTSASSPNVIGVLPGKGELANETVVLGAHYDHVGMGGYGSLAPGTVAIHNGADDNASGTATMLAAGNILVKQLSQIPSHRRILLIAFTGEERGLIGSKYYVSHPLFPLDNTVAMVNLDMVGRLRDNELTVYGTGSASEMDKIVEDANETRGFTLFKIPTGYGPSDHQTFYQAEIPVLFFFTGLHNDYHRPTDDFDKIDFGGMTRITDIVSDVTLRLAVQSSRPTYRKTDQRVQIRRQLTTYLGITLTDRGDHVVISAVAENSPAKSGGLRVGDQLSRFGKRRIRTSDDVFELLRVRSPGDELRIQILRAGETKDVIVKLGKRPQR